MKNDIVEPKKRRRGRPRKTSSNKNMNMNNENNGNILENIMKSGAKNNSNNNSNNLKKKNIVNNIVDNISESDKDEPIILNMPINIEDIKKLRHDINFNDNKSVNSNSTYNKDIFTIDDFSDNSPKENNYKNNDVIANELKKRDKIINDLKQELNEYKMMVNENANYNDNSRKVIKMNINFIESKSGNTIIHKNTDICCWWCTEKFDNLPCFIPEKHSKGKYHVFGCFCSYNCAAAYNISMNDYKVWDRYSLIKRLYNDIYENNENLVDVDIAPPRETLKKFGGHLSIQEFRGSGKNDREYRFIMPPMVSIIPFIEEGVKESYKLPKIRSTKNNKENKYNKDDLVLKRSKPLPREKSTIISSFGIKI